MPAAPLLVPEVAGGSAGLDEELRDACRSVVTKLCETNPEVVVVIANWSTGGSWPADGTWDFHGFGLPARDTGERPVLPWPLGIGAWLLDDADWQGDRGFATVGPDATTQLAIGPSRVAVLAVGDGTARRTEKAPGHLDERAEPFDAAVAAAIRDGNVEALGGLDANLASDLLCAGAPVWRWLATALAGQDVVEAELLADSAPYGVAYFAGFWRLSR
jgi:hypothetical protein